jgi:dihydroflavonol-4-reductase
MKIAIIGATGMLGHHTVIAAISAGHEVVCIHRASSDLTQIHDLHCELREADLNDKFSLIRAFRDVDGVINCAGYYPTKPETMLEHVVRATTQMEYFYEACSTAKIQRILYVGAAIALQKPANGNPGHADYDYPEMPPENNPYLRVKWAMDKQAQQKAEKGMPVLIGVPAMSFGEYDFKPTTGRLITEIANQTLPAYVSGKRNVIYAGDAGRGLVLALEKGRVGERYVFTGQNIEVDEIVNIIARLSNVQVPKAIPLVVAKIIAKFQEKKYELFGGALPKLDATAIAILSSGQYLDGTKAQHELGFFPQIGVEEAISITLSWFKKTGYVKGVQ